MFIPEQLLRMNIWQKVNIGCHNVLLLTLYIKHGACQIQTSKSKAPGQTIDFFVTPDIIDLKKMSRETTYTIG